MSWQIDPSHSQVQFSVKHMMISTVRGGFGSYSAEADVDPSDIGKSSVHASVKAESIQTGDEQRDAHLRSADFLDVEKYPEMKLSTRAVRVRGEKVEVDVDLTIRDMTKPVTLSGEVMGPAKDPWGNQRIGCSLSGEVDREEFGLTWNQALETGGFLVGKKVKVEIDAQFVEQ